MGMVPEAAVAMLACARIGAVHSVIFGGFAADAIRDRMNDAQAKLIITKTAPAGAVRSCRSRKTSTRRSPAARPSRTRIVLRRCRQRRSHMQRGRDLDWHAR
jgi:acetyl-CoA synthetase